MAILVTLGGIIGAIAVHIIASEFYHQTPRWALLLIRAAVRALPKTDQPRYLEEWTAHLEEQTGALAKMMHAIECWFAARALGKVLARKMSIAVADSGTDRRFGMIDVSPATAIFVFEAAQKFVSDPSQKARLAEAVSEMRATHGPLGAPDPTELKEFGDLLLQATKELKLTRNEPE